MEFLICGSAAAEGWPALFCNCRCCLEARGRGGKDLRTRTAYQLGDEIRIDFGPDSLSHMLRFSLPFERLRHLLFTHSHDDHLHPVDLAYRKPGFSVVAEENILTVHGNAHVRRRLEAALDRDFARHRLAFQDIQPGVPIPLGEGMRAIPVPAAHTRAEECVFYLLQVGEKTLLQGNDTGWFDDAAWDLLRQYQVDVAVLDCTYGKMEHRGGHLGCQAVVEIRDEMLKQGILKPQARVVANHFSHNGGWIHEEMEAFFQPHAIETGFDGMRIPL